MSISMILEAHNVSNAIRNDLQHPNEYVCGMTLRFLCKLREPELLEPLLPPCRACLVCLPQQIFL